MAIYDDGIDIKILKKLDDPIFVDYLWHRTCQINNLTVTNAPSRDSLEQCLKNACTTSNAQEFIRNHNVRDERPFGIVKWVDSLASEFASSCLTEEYYDWLDKKHVRLQYFIWRLMSHIGLNENKEQWPDKAHSFIYHPSILDENLKVCVNIDSRLSSTVSKSYIISTINRAPCNRIEKENLVRGISNIAIATMKNNEVLFWFESDRKHKVEWLCNYLEHNKSNYIPLVINGSSMQRDDLISFFDVLSAFNFDKYKLLVSNMKKAWSQKTYRDKNSNKKQYSINMNKDIGDILDKLSLAQNENKNAIVEALIRAEYEKIART